MSGPSPAQPGRPSFGGWMGSIWLFTILRFAMFGVLWGVLYLLGLSAWTSAFVALVLSVPLSFVLLARPRHRVAAQIEARVNARTSKQDDLSGRLDPDA